MPTPPNTSSPPFLDFYRIHWQYEPTSFPLRWEDDRVTEMFTPDFYLPEQDLYVELTTMKQSLVTRKNRKMRELRELYPDVNIDPDLSQELPRAPLALWLRLGRHHLAAARIRSSACS